MNVERGRMNEEERRERAVGSSFILGLRPRPAALHRIGRSPARTCAGTFFEILAHPSTFILVCAFAAGSALAQTYPARPIRLLVGGPPGSGADQVGRSIASRLSERLGQPVVVENKVGAGGIIAYDLLAKSSADGHTIGMLTGAHPTIAAMNRSLPYHPVRDFAMVGTVAAYPLVVSVVPASPIKSFPDLIARAKAAPGSLSYAMSTGSLVHLAGEWINLEAGTTMLAVPYKGSSSSIVDVVSGRVDVLIETATAAFAQLQAGKIRPLAVSSPARHPALPEVPTIAETLPGVEFTSWLGLATASGSPRAVMERLNAELRAVLDLPDVRGRIANLGGVTMPSTPAEMRLRVEREIARWTKLVADKNIEKQ